MKSLSLVAFMSLLVVCHPSPILEDEGYVTLHICKCKCTLIYIYIYRNDPDLPFGFWFLGQQDHGMQKRRPGLVNSFLLPKSEEREILQFGIIKPVALKKVDNTLLAISFIILFSCKSTIISTNFILVCGSEQRLDCDWENMMETVKLSRFPDWVDLE